MLWSWTNSLQKEIGIKQADTWEMKQLIIWLRLISQRKSVSQMPSAENGGKLSKIEEKLWLLAWLVHSFGYKKSCKTADKVPLFKSLERKFCSVMASNAYYSRTSGKRVDQILPQGNSGISWKVRALLRNQVSTLERVCRSLALRCTRRDTYLRRHDQVRHT